MHRTLVASILSALLVSCGGAVKTDRDAPQDATPDMPADILPDQAADAPEDVTEDPTPDITVDIAPDDEEDTAADPTPGCGTDGALLWGICWYLGDFTESCTTVCSSHGGYHPDTPEYVGTASQGGSAEECGAILDALGYSGTVSEGYRDDGLGLGCHVWRDGGLWWLERPDFDPGDAADNGRIVCGCNA